MKRITEVLDIDVPILQSGMAGVAGPALVAAVADAGALGTLALLRLTPDQVRGSIRAVRAATSKPFAANIWLHDELLAPDDPATISSDTLGTIEAFHNEVRDDLGLDRRPASLPSPGVHPMDAIEVMLDERVAVFCAAIGVASAELVERCHSAGTKVVNMVASVEDALLAVDHGVDVVVAQGSESGGHRSYGAKHERAAAVGTGTMALIPQVVDAVGDQVPVAAAGGIADGRGLAAAMMLGASGVLLGTRFVATAESEASALWKERLVAQSQPVTLTDAFTGQWAKTLPASFADRHADAAVPTLPGLLQAGLSTDIVGAARSTDDPDHQPLYAGDSAPLVNDLPAAGEVIASIVADAEALMGRSLG